MSVKRSYILGVINHSEVSKANDIISKYAVDVKDTTSYMYFAKQPIKPGQLSNDVIFFQMVAENDRMLKEQEENLISELNNLDTDYVLRDNNTGEFLVTVKYGAQVAIKFDKVKFLEPGTFEKIDELKFTNTDFGYCKGFKPNFRPLEGKSTESVEVLPEIIYITSDSEENLLKLRDFVAQKALEIHPDLETEFTWFFK